ncbi:MAG TPA: hypothetical protein EYP63_06320 [Desulfotomaculum sp.]|nr:hypothetical protein [Desulfotomaculum sp.]
MKGSLEAFGFLLAGFVMTETIILLAFRKKWKLEGYEKSILGLLFPGVVQAAAGRPIWGSALNFALLMTCFVVSWFCLIVFWRIPAILMDNATHKLLYGTVVWIAFSPLWLSVYLLNVWEVYRAPQGVENRRKKAVVDLLTQSVFAWQRYRLHRKKAVLGIPANLVRRSFLGNLLGMDLSTRG